jgi:dihydrofolate synthase/folylpolyglutamate synthase
VSYKAALDRLYSLSSQGIALGLDRVRRAAVVLGSPERGIRCVQVAGTNGKGTVSTVLARALSSSGVRTGLFTSPHLHRFSERIQIDGREITPEELQPHLEAVLALTAPPVAIPLTFFETATLAALSAFRASAVEAAVLEVGLGGRLDATSIVHPVLTAVTSIGFDHTAFLGSTLDRIAQEKAAIAKKGVPLVLGRLPGEAQWASLATADRIGAPHRLVGRDFSLPEDIIPPWPGRHQRDNTAIAFELYRLFLEGDPRFSEKWFRAALETVHLPGRFEILETRPRVILDGAHNLEAIEALCLSLESREEHPDALLFGVLADKPAGQMLARLRPRVGEVVLVPPPIHRALDPRVLAEPGDAICDTINDGIARAHDLVPPEGTILVTGSMFTVGAVRGKLLGEPSDPPIGL